MQTNDLDKKKLKAEYDKLYRLKNKEKIKQDKKLYNESEAGRAMQKRARAMRKEYHKEYCRNPEQRAKEKHRRHIRENKLGVKHCIVCNKDKPILDFEAWRICKDGRSYICRECEHIHQRELGCSTQNVITAMVMRPYTNLTREDIVKHPYLVEANKYLILLKQLTK